MDPSRVLIVNQLARVNAYYRKKLHVCVTSLKPPTEPFFRIVSGDDDGGSSSAASDSKARKKRKRQRQQRLQLEVLVASGKFVPLEVEIIDMLTRAHQSALLSDDWRVVLSAEGRDDAVEWLDDMELAVATDSHANKSNDLLTIQRGRQICVMPPHSEYVVGDARVCLQANCTALGKFPFIVMDPPWENKSVNRKSCYATFDHKELFKLPINVLAASDTCVLAIWVTNRPTYMGFILDELLPRWGFTHHATWYWLKICTNGELVSPLTSSHRLPVEKLVVAVRAASAEQLEVVRARLGAAPKVIVSVPLRHSWKPPPESFFDEHILKKHSLELFARELRPWFVSVGNEPLRFQTLDHFKVGQGYIVPPKVTVVLRPNLSIETYPHSIVLRRRMRLTPTRRRRRGNGAIESWNSDEPAGDQALIEVTLPPHVAGAEGPSTAGAATGRTAAPTTVDHPVNAERGAGDAATAVSQIPLGDTHASLVATKLLQQLDQLQADLDRSAGRQDIHFAHDYRVACIELIKQFPLFALSRDIDHRLWSSWQRELSALEGRLVASPGGDEERKLRDALYVALRNYSALIQDVKTSSHQSTGSNGREGTIALLVHRLSLAHAHVMYALEIHSASQEKKNWRMPELYYERARRWCVRQGETHYHLARIVLHDGRCSEALYHLVRSRIAATPFDNPGSLAEQFVHVQTLRSEGPSEDPATEAACWIEYDRAVLAAVGQFFGQQQQFMAHRRAPLEFSSALCTLLDFICKDDAASSLPGDEAYSATRSIRVVRMILLVIACACLPSDLVQATPVATQESDLVTVKHPRAVELIMAAMNGLLHRILCAITSPLRSIKQKELVLQLMLPPVNIAFQWLVKLQWRDMVAETTRASCEQLSTMLLTGIIAGGFLAPHEEVAPSDRPPSLEEEIELHGFLCCDGTSTTTHIDLDYDPEASTDGEILQRRVVNFLSRVEAFMTPRPAEAAVIASAAPAVDHSVDLSQRLTQMPLNTESARETGAPEHIDAGSRELYEPEAPIASAKPNKVVAQPRSSAPSTSSALLSAIPPRSSTVTERVVVLDSANIAMRHGLQRRFSCRGIQLCAEYFIAQGDRVVAFLPDYCLDVDADGSFRRRMAYSGGGGRARRREGRCTITPDDRVLLEVLVDSGVVVLTPAMDSDDLYCIHYARRHDAFLVTNDLFRDHISETEGPKARQTELRNWLQTRRISYAWVADEFLPNPNSAYEKMRAAAAS